jgi:hypothetical protein
LVNFNGAIGMTQTVQTQRAFAGDVPANLRCGFCGQPVQGQFYRAANRFTCDNCAAQIRRAIGHNSVAPGVFAVAAAAGLLAGLVGGAVWAAVVEITHINVGILAALIGVAVGKAIHFVSGKSRGVALQWLSAILAVIGVAGGDFMIACWEIVKALHKDGAEATPQIVLRVLQDNARMLFSPMDLVWIAIAAYAAWRLCKPANISIAGPYQYKPANSGTGGGLQFDTVEPIDPPRNP